MRAIIVAIVAVTAALVAMGAGTFTIAAAENCKTGDSALCADDPNCHWDFERRGCYQGAPDPEDPCAAHGDKKPKKINARRPSSLSSASRHKWACVVRFN
jgi:hypothetical protein